MAYEDGTANSEASRPIRLRVRTAHLDRARELVGVSKQDLEREASRHENVGVRLPSLHERPGLGSASLSSAATRRNEGRALPSELMLVSSLSKGRLKRRRQEKERLSARNGSFDDDGDGSEEEEEVSKADSVRRRRRMLI